MNLLMVGLDLNPPWVEGIRNTVYELALGLLDRGHEVHFLTKGYNYHERIEHLKCGITFHRILTKVSSGYLRGFQSFLLRLPNAISEIMKGQKVDVVHAHSSYPAFGWYIGVTAMLTNAKKIFSLYSYNTAPPTFEYPSVVIYALRLAKSHKILGLSNLNTIIVNSKEAFNTLNNEGFCRKSVHYVPVGIDTSRFKPNKIDETKLKDELNIPNEARVILFAGDLTPVKGVERFLFSLKELKSVKENFVGIILTKGLYEKELNRRQVVRNLVTRLDLGKNVRLLGIRGDIESIYNLSDVVVFPFLQSYTLMDIPRALLEAMACGRPIVATKVGAIHEIIEHGQNGILIEPNNESALKNALTFLLQNEENAKEIGENATSFIINNNESSKMISKVEEVYRIRD